MPKPKCGPFDLRLFRQDALRRGVAAREAARAFGAADPDRIFAAALLQDVAIPIAAKALPREYAALMIARADRRVPLYRLERTAFGWSHAEAGAALAAAWHLPAGFAELIRRHIDIEALRTESAVSKEQAAVAFSSLVPSAADEDWPAIVAASEAYRQWAVDGAPTFAEWAATVDRRFAEFAPLLQLVPSGKTLSERSTAVVVEA